MLLAFKETTNYSFLEDEESNMLFNTRLFSPKPSWDWMDFAGFTAGAGLQSNQFQIYTLIYILYIYI